MTSKAVAKQQRRARMPRLYHGPIMERCFNHIMFFVVNDKRCCFFCGQLFDDCSLQMALLHATQKHSDKVKIVVCNGRVANQIE